MRRVLSAAVAALALLPAAGCTGGRDGRIVVGSKNFTEQILLAEYVAQQIESRLGVRVDRRVNLGGTLICHQALRAGEIDLYVEYTGTALTAILHEAPQRDPRAVLERVRREYARRDGLVWTEPLGFDNTFAMVVRGADARRLGLRRLSDLAPLAPGWRVGIGYEFLERPDGYAGLVAAYGLRFGRPPLPMDLGLLYRALQERQVDLVAGNATDGVIEALDLVVLEDDRHYFPPYEAAPVVRRRTLLRHPGLREALRELGGTLTAAQMRRLNYAVDGEGRDVREVIRAFRAGAAPGTPAAAAVSAPAPR
jgi:osmoprotectant transport system substrate-binding protein